LVLILVLILLFTAMPATAAPEGKPSYGNIELAFEPNRGQADPNVKFLTRGSRAGLLLTSDDAILRLAGSEPVEVRMKFPGRNRKSRIEGIEPLIGRTNYLIGPASESAPTDIPHYKKVRYYDVYPGIDVVYYGNNRLLEYDFIVKPGADPKKIRIAFSGARAMHINPAGDLVIGTGADPIVQKKPRVYQQIDGAQQAVDAAYVMSSGDEVGVKLGPYDKTKPLVIDPVLVYSTYFGGTGSGDQPYSIAVDATGSVYVAGFTTSTDLPIIGGAQSTYAGQTDAFIVKLDPTGTQVVYSTYIGGSSTDEAHSLAVDAGGNVYITGFTTSPNFPIVNGFQATRGGAQDAYFLKLNSAGNAIVFSSYLGGTADDRPFSLAIDPSNNIYIAGSTASGNFPTMNPYQANSAGGFADIFVTKIGTTGSLLYSTYVGGFGNDQPLGIAVDAAGGAYVTGFTTSLNFPVVNAVQVGFGGNPDDAFVFKLSPAGSALEYSTFLGGIASDNGVRIAVDKEGGAYVTGMTASLNFPTAKAYQILPAGESDAFLTRLSPDGKTVVFSTFFGGFQTESGTGIAVDVTGNIYVAGYTNSFDLPTANGIQQFIGGNRDAFIVKFMPDGNSTMFATFLGGLEADAAVSMAVDATENIYVTGLTNSANFPIVTPVQETNATAQDVFIAKINAKDIVASSPFQVASQGGSSVITRGTRTDAVFGYATAEPGTAGARLTGLAIVDSRQQGAIASEVAVLAPKALQQGRLFVDVSNVARSVLSIANPTDEEASVDFVFTDETGTSSRFANVKVAPRQHFSRFVTDDPLLIDRPGTLNYISSIPVTATSFRTIGNEAGDFLLSSTPIADPDPARVTNQPLTVPELAEGAGWSTEIVLVNTTEDRMNGEIHFVSQGSATQAGTLFEVGVGDGTTSVSALEYDIPSRSFQRFNTAGIASRSEVEIAGATGFAFTTPGAAGVQVTGQAAAQSTDPNARLNGLEILEYRDLGVVQSQVGLVAPSPRQSGRLFVENAEKIRTMIAISNPSQEQEATVEFTLTDDAGTAGTPVTVTIATGGQSTNFLGEAPFSLGVGTARTLNFTSNLPVFVTGLRFFTNERNDSLLTSVPMTDTSRVVDQPVVIPHFTNGAGWTSDVVLVNMSDSTVSGEVRFLSQGSGGQPVQGVTVGTGIGTASLFEYSIPPGSYKRIATNGFADEASGIPDSLAVGSVHIVPSGGTTTPLAHAIVAQRVGANTIFQTSIEAQTPSTGMRLYAEAFGDFPAGSPKSTHTAIALANSSAGPVTVELELIAFDGRSLGTSGAIEIPATGQRAMFLNQAPGFESLRAPLQAIVRVNVTAGAGVAAVGLRAMINERSDFIATTTGPLNEAAGLPGRVVFPYIADGTGYTTQFILVTPPGVQTLSGVLRFLTGDSSPLQIDVLRLGSVRVVPFPGFNTPHAHAILTRREQGVVVFQTFAEGQLAAPTHRFYVESIGNFEAGITGSTRSAIALANPSSTPVTVRLDLTLFDGRLAATSRPIQIPALGQVAMFVHQIPGLEGVPIPFQGVLRLTTTSGAGVSAVGMRAMFNERGVMLFTTTGPLIEDAGLPGQLVFPHIAEGGGYTTQFIVVSGASGPSSSGILRFFNDQGNPLSVTLTER
jgi:hypothetical protein